MRTIKSYFAFLTVFAMLFASCSKEENVVDDPTGETSTISFATVLNDMVNKQAALKQQLDIPECSDETPAFVEIVLTGPTDVGSDENPLVVAVNPNAGDYDGDSEAEYFTEESSDLELQPGTYTLEHFIVYDGNPGDPATNALWIAPRDGGDMADFVSNPLPNSFDLSAGVKKYVDVEVLCFDDRMVNEYGYLFFDIEENEAIEFCIFGNYCPPSGRHYPAEFSVDVWTYADGETIRQIHDDLANVVEIDENGDWAGTTVCMALPDTEGLDEYYVEITMLSSDAYGEIEERVIRQAVITDDEVKNLFDGDNNLDYYHFREGCDGDDTPPIFPDPEDDSVFYKTCLYSMEGLVAGFAYVSLDGDEMTTTVIGGGFAEDGRHPQQIYSGDCSDLDSDEVLLSLTDAGGEYPFVEAYEAYNYQRTWTFGEDGVPVDLELDNTSVVFKGQNVEGEFDASIPVACGELIKQVY